VQIDISSASDLTIERIVDNERQELAEGVNRIQGRSQSRECPET